MDLNYLYQNLTLIIVISLSENKPNIRVTQSRRYASKSTKNCMYAYAYHNRQHRVYQILFIMLGIYIKSFQYLDIRRYTQKSSKRGWMIYLNYLDLSFVLFFCIFSLITYITPQHCMSVNNGFHLHVPLSSFCRITLVSKWYIC